MSSSRIDLAPSLVPSAGILLNVSEEHIDRHGTLENYAAVKERLVAGVQPRGTSIVGVDDSFCRNIADRLDQAGKNVVRISVKNPLASGIYVARATSLRAAGRAPTEVARMGPPAAGALRADCATPGDEAAERLLDVAPGAVARAVGMRVARQGPDAGELDRAGAILGDGAPLQQAAATARPGASVRSR